MRTHAPSSEAFRPVPIAEGVYANVADAAGTALCNTAVVDLGGRTVVFDSTLTPATGAALRRSAERLTGRRPDWVVNSHWHGDHVWGNAALLPAHVVSTRTVRTLILRQSRAQFDACRRTFPRELRALDRRDSPIDPRDRPRLRGWLKGVIGAPSDLAIEPPDLTFESSLELAGARRTLRLLSYGGGHSPSDVFGLLEDERIVLAGDLAMVGLHPAVSDGRPDRWRAILRRIRALRPERVVPGHGPVGSLRDVEETDRYLSDLERAAAAAVRSGTSLRDLRARPVPARYRDWEFAFMYPDNLERAYRLARATARSRDRKGGSPERTGGRAG